jgi:hypothetical protein
MVHIPHRAIERSGRSRNPEREASDYIYQAATIAAALLLLLTAAVV